MNGNLFEFQNFFSQNFIDDRTDTQRFNDKVLRKLPKGFLKKDKIRICLENYAKQNRTRIIFMDGHGEVALINEEMGEWINGCFYSVKGIADYNGYGYSGAYSYDVKRHPGGIISKQFLHPEKRNTWGQCHTCKGYFLRGDLLLGKKTIVCENCHNLLKLQEFIVD